MLSILIPTYNYNVLPLVNELIKQLTTTKIEYEIIVFDDYSTDSYCIKENQSVTLFKNCFFEKNKDNVGRTYTRKLLAEKAKYNWLLFLDSDVLPTKDIFIQNYISHLNENYDVIIGGYKYERKKIESTKLFRYNYGINCEEKTAKERNKKQYSYIFSGNLLIKKDIFIVTNFQENKNIYGLDLYFTYQLFIQKAKILHIDNPIFHLGIENNEVFFNKSISSLKDRINLLKDKPLIEEVDKMIKIYKICKKYRFDLIIYPLFKISAPLLKKLILSNRPQLIAFDLYRLGYICGIKN